MAEGFAKGAAPWETSKSPTGSSSTGFAKGAAPWEDKSGTIDKYADLMSAKNEQHPDIDFLTRTMLQNFGNSPEAKAEYLKTKGFEARPLGDQVLVRKPGEPQWSKLAHKGLEFKDVTDNVYNAGAGIASGVAGATAAVGAALPTGGLGSIPAAMAASGVTSAGLEASRQGIGEMYGIPQEIRGRDVAIQGAAGAVAPFLFGTGGTAAKLAAKGIAAEAVPALAASQRGMVGRGASVVGQHVLPAVGEFFSGVPKKAIQTLANRGDELNALGQEGAYNDFVDATHQKIKSGIWDQKLQVGKALENEVGSAGGTVNINEAKAIIDGHIETLEKSELKNNPLIKDQIAELKKARNGIFQEDTRVQTSEGSPMLRQMLSKMDPAEAQAIMEQHGITQEMIDPKFEMKMMDMPGDAAPKKAFELQHLLADYADVSKMKEGPMSRLSGTPAEKQWANANMGAYKNLNEQLAALTDGATGDLKNQYARYSKLQKNLQTYMNTPERTGQTLQNLNNPGKQYLRGSLEDLRTMSGGAVDVQPAADLLQAHKFLQNPGWTPVSSGGTTSTSRTLGLGTLGGAIGYKLGGYQGMSLGLAAGNAVGSPAAIKLYTNAIVGANNVTQPLRQFATPVAQGVWNTIYNKDRKKKDDHK